MVIKSFKGLVHKIAKEEYGHVALVRLLDVTDDTVLLKKAILKEMMQDKAAFVTLLSDKYARLAVLHILAPRSSKYFPPDVVKLLEPAFVLLPESSQPTSKKEASVRRQELLEGLLDELLDLLLLENLTPSGDAPSINVLEFLVTDQYGSAVLCEILLLATGPKKTDAFNKLGKLCSGKDESIMAHFVGSRALKRLVGKDEEFAGILLDNLGDNLLYWSQQKGSSFVVAALLESTDSSAAKRAREVLKPHSKTLKGSDVAGTQVIVQHLEKQ